MPPTRWCQWISERLSNTNKFVVYEAYTNMLKLTDIYTIFTQNSINTWKKKICICYWQACCYFLIIGHAATVIDKYFCCLFSQCTGSGHLTLMVLWEMGSKWDLVCNRVYITCPWTPTNDRVEMQTAVTPCCLIQNRLCLTRQNKCVQGQIENVINQHLLYKND